MLAHNPFSYGLLDSVAPMWGPKRPPSDIKEGVISEPIYILISTFKGPIQKFTPKFQNVSNISGFQNFAKLRIHEKLTVLA